jgi:hypothetical protein
MRKIFDFTILFAKFFPKIGITLSVLSFVIPLILIIKYNYPETILYSAIYVEIFVVGTTLFMVLINSICRKFMLRPRTIRIRARRRNRKFV